jgi:hypothetical protein
MSGSTPTDLWATYYLRTEWDELLPGDYDARIEFRARRDRFFAASDAAAGQPPHVWIGVVSTATFSFTILDAPLESLHLEVPRHLTIARDRIEAGDLLVTYGPKDADKIDVLVHHGFDIGSHILRDDGSFTEMGPPTPDDINGIDRILPNHVGAFRAKYSIEIYERAEPPRHLVTAGPGSYGWRVLWAGKFDVGATAAEINALRK